MKKIIFVLPVLLTLIISGCNTELESTDVSTTGSNTNCESACENYKTQCLQLVPGATQQMFKDGIESCMNECKDWSTEKSDCMATALDCTSMTDICEL